MKTVRPFTALLVCALAACAPTVTTPAAPAPTPAPGPAPAVPVVKEAAPNWHLLDPADGVVGISLLRAQRELLASKQPKRTVVVAVIDAGIDTMHPSLRQQLWVNSREKPNNGVDDDGNGFVDDVYGWNFIGGKDNKSVDHDTFELTRLAAQCERSSGRDSLSADYRAKCVDIQSEFARKHGDAEQTLMQVRQFEQLYNRITPYLKAAARTDTLTVKNVTAIVSSNDTVRDARRVFLQLAANGITPQDVDDAMKAYSSQLQWGYNKSFDPRPIVGDNYPDTTIKRYGNHDTRAGDPLHGTHVAGIIGGKPGGGTVGIDQAVRLMAVRAVPDGDERDKDIANAIRYAVDNGANVINMSFGKGYSPYKNLVDAAVKYADSKGVLMVHAAGNDGNNTSELPSYPTPVYLDGGRAVNWIEVGASSWRGRDSLAASFSNYSKALVDVFAPGVAVTSTVPGGGYRPEDGTSMASPVVAGVAALIMSYYPTLSATDVKKIILESATRESDVVVARPGAGGGSVKFGELSATGGIVNAYAALKLAEQMTAARP